MKVTSVEIFPDGSTSSVVLSFKDPQNANPYNVLGITGLDAEAIVPRYYGVGGVSKFFNLSLASREIVFQIGLNPNYGLNQSYSDLRDALYRVIASSRTGKVQVAFKNGDDITAVVGGFVTKGETPQFEKEQEFKLTIDCDDPMLRALNPILIDGSLMNPVGIDIKDPLSTAPHGFSFVMTILAAIPSLKFFDPSSKDWDFEVAPTGGFLAGDILAFSSEVDAKTLYLVRGTDTIYLADVVTVDSIWPILFPGSNQISVDQPTAVSWYLISYYPAYWGV